MLLNVSYMCCRTCVLHGRCTGGLALRECVAHLVLPVDGDAARVELAVEVVVGSVQADPFDGGELVDVLHVAAVH